MFSCEFCKIYIKKQTDSSTGAFLWILRNFQEHLFSQNTSGGCFWRLTKSQIRSQGCVPLLKLRTDDQVIWTCIGNGFFICTSHFVTRKYFIVKDNEFRLDRNLIRPLGYIRTGAVFLQGSLLERNSQNLSWNYGTSIYIHVQHEKERACREKILFFAFKQIRAYFSKLGYYFPVIKKR